MAALHLAAAPSAGAQAQMDINKPGQPLQGPATAAPPASPDDLVVTNIGLTRRRIVVGQTIRIFMTLRNQGPTVARSQQPAPSTVYALGEDFKGKGFDAQPGQFSVAMTVSGPQGNEWPFRWGIGGDLPLARVRTVSYPIRFTAPGTYSVFVGVGVGDGPVRRIETPNLTGIRVLPDGKPAPGLGNIIPPTPPTRITVNGKAVEIDQRPILSNATIMVPLRFVLEELGAQVKWDPAKKRVTARRGSYDLALTIGQKYNTANGKEVYVYNPPFIASGRTMVPLRFITEALGGTITWDEATKTVAITTPPLPS